MILILILFVSGGFQQDPEQDHDQEQERNEP
jgi:hypothetical protein